MKTIIAFIWSLLVLAVGHAQKSLASGHLIEFNSKFETGSSRYISNALVEEELGRSNPVLTKLDGHFMLELISVPEKTNVKILVTKEGWEVVNTDGLNVVSGSLPTKIYLTQAGKITESKRQYYKIGKTAGEKYLEQRLAKATEELNKLLAAQQKDSQKIMQLNEEITKLQINRQNFESNLTSVVNRLAYVNLDEANERSIQAFTFFNDGDIQKALEMLNIPTMEKESLQIDSMYQKGQKLITIGDSIKQLALNRKSQLARDYMMGADLAQLKSDYKIAYEYYKGALREEPQNVGYKLAFVNFLVDQKRFSEAIDSCRMILISSSDKKILAGASTQMGNLLRITRDRAAVRHYNDALSYSNSLNQNESLFYRGIAYNGLGNVYFEINRDVDSAKYFYQQAYTNKKKLLDMDSSEANFHELLKTSSNLIAVYSELQECNADSYANSAITYYEALASQKPTVYLTYLGKALSNYSMYLRHCGRHQEALAQNVHAIEVYEKLAKNNSQLYQPDLSLAYVNIGSIYDDLSDYKNAEIYARKSYVIRKHFFEIYPDAYNELLALAVTNLAKAVYYGKKDSSSSIRKKAAEEILLILKETKANLNRYKGGNAKKLYLSQIETWLSRFADF